MRKVVTVLLILSIVFISAPAFANDREVNIVADIALVRPLSLAATILGTAGFIVALPFSIPSGSVNETAKVLIAEPFHYTFSRPIGEFENCYVK